MTTTDTSSSPSPTYTFGRRDRGGMLLGFKLTQLIVLGLGFAAVLVGLLANGAQGGVLGLLTLVVSAVLALYPVQGRTLVDWVRPLANFGYARFRKDAAYLGGPTALHRTRDANRIDLPGVGQHLRVYEAETAEGRIAALRVGDRWTVVLKVRGTNYVLADRASQERRIAAWGALLSQAGQEGSRIAALQWLERAIPDSGHDLQAWWQAHGDPASPYAKDYERLIEHAGPAATRHECYVAVAIDAQKLRRPIRQAGGGPEGTTKVLLAELAWVRQALARADIDVQGVLDAADFGRLVRTQYDPASSSLFDDGEAPSPVAAGPMAAEQHWDHYRSDSAVHAAYWITEWPSIPVEAGWIYPLISLGGVRRTISLTAEPIPPSRSLRELRSARVAKRADEAQRQRFGQVETAQDEEEYAALERRERELVRGHTEYRYTGWIIVTAPNDTNGRDALEAACNRIEQAAVRSALEVRRVYGEVDQAFLLGALPLSYGVNR
jgi:hypothetical protein